MADNLGHPDDLLFLPLGGCGEIGMNLSLYRSEGRWIMVDLGLTFANTWDPGIDLLFPDHRFAAGLGDKLDAIVLTHGHEDHIGAVPYLWRELRRPIYATPFTAALVRRKLEEAGLIDEVELYEVAVGGAMEIGPFQISYVPLAHSIPEGHGLKLTTSKGVVFHTGDWKLDAAPVIGKPSTPKALTDIGDEGVLAMVGDSTNVFLKTESGSEQAVQDSLMEIIGGCEGRVIVTTFSSNVGRVETIGKIAKTHGRQLICIGRSLLRLIDAAKETGYLQDFPPVLKEDAANDLPPGEVLIVCTGCQGEYRAALSRIARDGHPRIKLRANDTVIFSSKIIPGNEISIGGLVNNLIHSGVDVITEKDAFTHVSGHPGQAELKAMYGWIRPQIAVPVHGEVRHLQKHAAFARSVGVKAAIVPLNGDVIRLAPDGPKLLDQVPVGRLALDGIQVVPMDDPGLIWRRRMMQNGYLVVILAMRADGSLAAEPEIILKGLPGCDEGDGRTIDAIGFAVEETLRRLAKRDRRDHGHLGEMVRIAARRACFTFTGKKPVAEVRVVRI